VARIGIIGGTGAGHFPALGNARLIEVHTRYADEPLSFTAWHYVSDAGHTHEVIFVPRHGANTDTPPHVVNYRANIDALKELGVDAVIALNAVGGISGGKPGTLVIPDQLIDYSWGRAHTFYNGRDDAAPDGKPLEHIDFTSPFDATLRDQLVAAAAAADISITNGATYAVTQGPRLETAAEVDRLERDGCHIIGMTLMPEAGLAAEAGLPYACIAGVVNYAAGRAEGPIHDQIEAYVSGCMTQSQELVSAWLNTL